MNIASPSMPEYMSPMLLTDDMSQTTPVMVERKFRAFECKLSNWNGMEWNGMEKKNISFSIEQLHMTV